jgi:hypothetical protein
MGTGSVQVTVCHCHCGCGRCLSPFSGGPFLGPLQKGTGTGRELVFFQEIKHNTPGASPLLQLATYSLSY